MTKINIRSLLIILMTLPGDYLFASQNGFSIYLPSNKNIPGYPLMVKGLKFVPLDKKPIITTNDIVSYDGKTHEMVLTSAGFAKVTKMMERNISLPFVICVGNERIYAGDIVKVICSASFSGVVIEEGTMCALPGDKSLEKNEIFIQLGYPNEKFFVGQDPRSDSRILKALKQAGKLK